MNQDNLPEFAGAIRLASPEEMASMDQHAIAGSFSAKVLMERAASAVADMVIAQLACQPAEHRKAVFCCGVGNNGGDGYAAARLVVKSGAKAVVVALSPPRTAEAKANASAWQLLGKTLLWEQGCQAVLAEITRATVLVDAICGTGLTRPLTGATKDLVQCFNQSKASFKLAVDIPTGLDGWQGNGFACICDATCSFQVPQPGLYQSEATGRISIADIGIPIRFDSDAFPLWLLTPQVAARLMPKRNPQAHKYQLGRVFCIAGSSGMAGAAWLAAQAALRTGAGSVTLAVPPALLDKFVQQAPELITSAANSTGSPDYFKAEDAAHFLALSTGTASPDGRALVLGCGLGRNPSTAMFVKHMLNSPLPLVLDADALNALDFTNPADLLLLKARTAPTVLTPHTGEFCRLFGVAKIGLERIKQTRWASQITQAVVVLKGANTIIAAPDGTTLINTSGDEGLATAGSGDVLSGMIGALLARRLSPLSATALAVSWHGLARDLHRSPAISFTASMLIQGLVHAAGWLEDHSATAENLQTDHL